MSVVSHQDVPDVVGSSPGDTLARAEQRRLAQLILPRTEEISADMQTQLLLAVPELNADGDDRAAALIRESADQTVGMLFSTLAFGLDVASCEPAEGTIQLLRDGAATGGDATTIMHCYRIGHRHLWQAWNAHLAEHVGSPECLREVLRTSSEHFFAYIDRMCERVLEAHRCDVGATGAGEAGPTTRAAIIDRLLDGGADGVAFPGQVLGYDLAAHHVGLVLSPVATGADVAAALQGVVRAGGHPRVLQQARPDGTLWAWLGFGTHPSPALLDGLRTDGTADDVIVGVGAGAVGREGFRSTHAQALEAVEAARLGPDGRGGVFHHGDVELAALLCVDRRRAERLVASRLGMLAGTDETCRRLRETLRVYIANGRSKIRTAAELHVHQKTVTYRINQAEELLGRPVGQATAELDAALRIHRTLTGG